MRIPLIFFFYLICCQLHAFRFSPMSLSINPDEDKKAYLTVTNNSAKKIPIEISITTREMDNNGTETNVETEDFSFFPSQVILEPNQKRKIKITWLKETPAQELAFRLIAEELPLSLPSKENDKTGIKVLMKYIGSLYVTPASCKSQVNTLSSQLIPQEKRIEIHLKNSGCKHQVLTDLKVKIKDNSKEYHISSENLSAFNGENILAGKERIFEIKNLPMELTKGNKRKIDIDLDYLQ